MRGGQLACSSLFKAINVFVEANKLGWCALSAANPKRCVLNSHSTHAYGHYASRIGSGSIRALQYVPTRALRDARAAHSFRLRFSPIPRRSKRPAIHRPQEQAGSKTLTSQFCASTVPSCNHPLMLVALVESLRRFSASSSARFGNLDAS
eukprot:6173306-Pleurochrysis_carterae.AAC.1